MTDQELIAHLEARNKALQAELRKPRRDPAAERLYAENKDLRAQTRLLQRRLAPLQAEHDRSEAIKAAVADATPPQWVLSAPRRASGLPGVPTVIASDWHTGETVRPALVGGKNRYSQEVQEARVRQFAQGTIDLLTRHVVNPRYPGIVVPLGGDMVSGSIHDELEITNWCEPRDAVRLTTGYLAWVIREFAEKFGNVYLPCVTGNHGRLTKRMQYKRRVGTSLDAMIYDGLAEIFKSDRNVTFDIAEGTSVRYRVYDHRFLLAHGDPHSIGQHGGDGIIGALGPIVRGKKKLLARNSQIAMEFDTILMGHWHQHLVLTGAVVNGSMKGFDELAWGEGYEYEAPSQALFLTHPERGITITAPVFLDPKQRKARREPWVSVMRGAA